MVKIEVIIKLVSFLIVLLSLQACSSLGNQSVQGTPIPLTPTLEPAINFEKGNSQVPSGYYAFIEFSGDSVFSPECQRAPGPPGPPRYDFRSSGELVTSQSYISPALSSHLVGLFGYAGSRPNQLYVIDALPYKAPPYDEFIIYSVDAQGVATIEIRDKTYFIKPGQSWTDSGDVKQEPPAGCHVAYSTRLSNYGLLSRAQIQFVDTLPWKY